MVYGAAREVTAGSAEMMQADASAFPDPAEAVLWNDYAIASSSTPVASWDDSCDIGMQLASDCFLPMHGSEDRGSALPAADATQEEIGFALENAFSLGMNSSEGSSKAYPVASPVAATGRATFGGIVDGENGENGEVSSRSARSGSIDLGLVEKGSLIQVGVKAMQSWAKRCLESSQKFFCGENETHVLGGFGTRPFNVQAAE